MPKGNTLNAGDSIHAVLVGDRDAHFELKMQSDGNLVFRSYLNNGQNYVCWSIGAKGSGARAVYQNDGNFVVYVGNAAKWASDTAGKGGNSVSIDYSDTWYPGTDLWVGDTRINRGCRVP
ncbi:hypothetical protein GCM10010124_41310 [Pilimelia terevasa]|uniref:Bulb-type lectin domain-containing protein n=2 Tax=Pilimelia terevasa TaxID=53372 RepID=A0A8J3BR82_9ACTN|nr:hypothetical protein GCM10010124_41310 [Pilimelia terevasa]